MKMMVSPFLTALTCNITDDTVDLIIDKIKEMLDYVEDGGADVADD